MFKTKPSLLARPRTSKRANKPAAVWRAARPPSQVNKHINRSHSDKMLLCRQSSRSSRLASFRAHQCSTSGGTKLFVIFVLFCCGSPAAHHRRRHHHLNQQQQQQQQQQLDNGVVETNNATSLLHEQHRDQWQPLGAVRSTAAAAAAAVRQRKLMRRQALNLALERLRVLESLDEQLRSFFEASNLATTTTSTARPVGGARPDDGSAAHRKKRRKKKIIMQPVSGDQQPEWATSVCRLGLDKSGNGAARPPECLLDARLRRQIPPYMVNVFRQLLDQAELLGPTMSGQAANGAALAGSSDSIRSALAPGASNEAAAAAQQLIPYRAQTMRSFRQPPEPNNSNSNDNGSKNDHDDDGEQSWPGQQELAEWPPAPHDGSTFAGRADVTTVELSLDDGDNFGPQEQAGATATATTSNNRTSVASSPACALGQRLWPAHERTQLCFWFRLDNWPARAPSERLVEAELHLFKLLPELSGRRHSTKSDNKDHCSACAASSAPASDAQLSTSSRLKTNLLEVSLHQILPRPSGANSSGDKSRADKDEHNGFPLRLLDIRRIDLHSSGWETFYVKRAVDDWLKDASTNLGLMIKAKSMFDEPIQIGLIRFADAYDHQWRIDQTDYQQAQRAADFDLSHQPLLVIYTRHS